MDDIQQIITYTVHQYMRDLLGDVVFMAISSFFILLGILLLVAAIANSNMLLGNPNNRDKSTLDDIQYAKTRQILRIVLGVIGFVIIVYNLFGLSS